MCQRLFPVINWDLSVMPCCNYTYRKLADNYLNISFEKVINLREQHPLCKTCQKHSLHRYFNPLYYSDFVEEILEGKNE